MIAALALVVGVVVGLILRPTVPTWLEPYLPIAVVAALDAVFGAVRAQLEGIFDDRDREVGLEPGRDGRAKDQADHDADDESEGRDHLRPACA